MSYIIFLISVVVAYDVYAMFYRTYYIKGKISKSFQGYERIEKSTFFNKSSFSKTNDTRQLMVLEKEGSEVILFSCSTHGQLKNIYLLCLIVDDDFSEEGIYGAGRVKRLCTRSKIDFNSYNLTDYFNENVCDLVLCKAETVEVASGKAYLYFSLGSYVGTDAIDVIVNS